MSTQELKSHNEKYDAKNVNVVEIDSGWTLTNPAKLHPEVIVQAVSARDHGRAEAFAKKHGIPEVKASYQGKS